MHEPAATAVYRVRPGAAGTWDIYRDELEEPVATFPDKGAALSFALSLARGRPQWLPLPDARRPPAHHGGLALRA